MRTRLIAGIAFAVWAGLAASGAVGTAQATYPGSNDGRIAFGSDVAGNTDIYSVLPSGRALHRLTDDPLFDACPAYSADGKRIAWCHGVRARGGVIEIWTMKQNGEDKQQLTSLGGRMTFPDFSPDGERIAFAGRLPGATNDDVFVVNADGSGLVQLTSDPGNDSLPAYSPDGSKLVFISNRSGLAQVWVMDADGTDPQQLTFDPVFKVQVPDWSPDGSRIAYAVGDPGDIWVMDADGTDAHPVIATPTDEFGPAWSPDGAQLAFIQFDDRTVYIADAADGGNRHAVHPLGLQAVPAWQPRGRRQHDD